MVAGNTTDTTYYMGSFEYKNGELNQIFTSEGRVRYDATTGEFNYDYYLKDHLGNTRVLFTDDGSGNAEALQVNNYYPFGMRFNQAPEMQSQENDYLYNGKEKQAFGLDWYDYGARFYDPALARWHVVDPMAEKYESWSVYQYVRNNPILRIDPNGMDDYKINKETGAMELVKETDDKKDRVLKTDGEGNVKRKGDGLFGFLVRDSEKGKAKVAFGGIQQGILEDGMNLKTENNIIDVNGEGQPTEKGVEAFALKLSEHIGKEIGGAYFSGGSNKITNITLGMYKNNRKKKTTSSGHDLGFRKGLNLKGFFHTHPTIGGDKTNRIKPHTKDKTFRNNALRKNPNLRFYIITKPLNYGDAYPMKIDYTEY